MLRHAPPCSIDRPHLWPPLTTYPIHHHGQQQQPPVVLSPRLAAAFTAWLMEDNHPHRILAKPDAEVRLWFLGGGRGYVCDARHRLIDLTYSNRPASR